eukprot:459362-Amphidinium_carterae.1
MQVRNLVAQAAAGQVSYSELASFVARCCCTSGSGLMSYEPVSSPCRCKYFRSYIKASESLVIVRRYQENWEFRFDELRRLSGRSI